MILLLLPTVNSLVRRKNISAFILYQSVQLHIFDPSNDQMAGRAKIYDENEALDKAIAVFWEKGYENASADDLLKAMGIGKGSFYLAYKGGKPELFERSLHRFFEVNLTDFLHLLKTSEEPIELIKTFFLSIADANSPIARYGCYFGNALVQIEDKNLKQVASIQLQTLKEAFIQALKRARKAGHLTTEATPEVLGLYLLNLWNGLNLTRKMEKDLKKLKALVELNLAILN
jgi:TetR/AcrR family transcriptional regulator, transcriptional repressor for nem operon